MFYYLYCLFINKFHYLNIFKYITFRSFGAAVTSFLICLLFMPSFIDFVRTKKGLQPIRNNGPESHFIKKGTPTMGGLLMLGAILFSLLIWADLSNQPLLIAMMVTFSYGILGLIDDWQKINKQNTKGVSGKKKMLFQIIISIVAYWWMKHSYFKENLNILYIPFFKNIMFDLGYIYIFFIALVTVGSSNAVNLTDGLDGLAIVPIIITTLCLGIFCYLSGHAVFAEYLQISHLNNVGEVSLLCAAIIGAGLGFLWYNCHPAQIFMGDTGSLALGGAIGIVSVLCKSEILLAIIGAIFVLEAVSVMLQVGYFKISKGKRLFLMAPLHHHFEKKGWPESKVVMRFWILSIIFALIGLSSLKIR